jgi:hypothetical protein
VSKIGSRLFQRVDDAGIILRGRLRWNHAVRGLPGEGLEHVGEHGGAARIEAVLAHRGEFGGDLLILELLGEVTQLIGAFGRTDGLLMIGGIFQSALHIVRLLGDIHQLLRRIGWLLSRDTVQAGREIVEPLLRLGQGLVGVLIARIVHRLHRELQIARSGGGRFPGGVALVGGEFVQRFSRLFLRVGKRLGDFIGQDLIAVLQDFDALKNARLPFRGRAFFGVGTEGIDGLRSGSW